MAPKGLPAGGRCSRAHAAAAAVGVNVLRRRSRRPRAPAALCPVPSAQSPAVPAPVCCVARRWRKVGWIWAQSTKERDFIMSGEEICQCAAIQVGAGVGAGVGQQGQRCGEHGGRGVPGGGDAGHALVRTRADDACASRSPERLLPGASPSCKEQRALWMPPASRTRAPTHVAPACPWTTGRDGGACGDGGGGHVAGRGRAAGGAL